MPIGILPWSLYKILIDKKLDRATSDTKTPSGKFLV